MKKRIVCFTVLMLVLITAVVSAGTINLPKTGQTKCYDTAGIEISCTGTGQDGNIQAGVAWPEPRFTDNGDGTVTDNLTGLMWTTNSDLPNGERTWQQALDYVKGMNEGTYSNFGYTDWRLPNVNELESLVNANEANSATWLNAQGFTNVQGGSYWSSTSCASGPDGAWIVSMWGGGGVGYDWKSYYGSYVWPVRGGQCGSLDHSVICLPKTGQTKCYNTSGGEIPCAGTGQDGEIQAGVAWPSPRFIDYGDGTVTDNLTGLMWTTNSDLPNGQRTWQQALDYVKGMNEGTYSNFGFTDWRLPNVNEHHSLTDYSKYNPAWPAGHPFTNVQAVNYWSSTAYAYYPGDAWVVVMWSGVVHGGSESTPDPYYVWPVRGGQVRTLIELSTFTATPSGRAVILTWTTASEIDNAGFNLYRAESENGEYVKLNSSLIPAQGSPTSGATYQYIDNDVRNRKTYYYKLEDIDLNGVSTLHGPVSATPRVIHNLR